MITSMDYRLGFAAGEAKGYVDGEAKGYIAGYAKAVHDFRAAIKKEDEERAEENKQRFLDGKREMLEEVREWIDEEIADMDGEEEPPSPGCSVPIPCPPWQEVTLTAEPVVFPMDELRARLVREANEYKWISPEDLERIRAQARDVMKAFFNEPKQS